jgi:hypothetical protein
MHLVSTFVPSVALIAALTVAMVGACKDRDEVAQDRDVQATHGQCSGLSREACRSAAQCRPIVDDQGKYHECIDDATDCGDDETCGSDGEQLAVFSTTCVPTGWRAIRYEECTAGCWLRNASECEQDERCVRIVDATSAFHECSVRYACTDAPVCASDGEGHYVLFTTSCIPNGWSHASSIECDQDGGN